MSRPPPPRALRHPGWRADVRAGLETMLAGPAGVALFDCDNTLLDGDISETMLADEAERTGLPLVRDYEAHVARDKLGAYVELVSTLCAGRTEPEVREAAEATLRRHPRMRLRPALRELVWAMHRSGWDVWVVTASPEVLVQAVAERLGVHPHRVLGMRNAVGDDGRYGTHLAPPATWREGKVEIVRAAVSGELRFAAGDSEGDLPMMCLCPHSLLVDLGSAAVRDAAAHSGAWIQTGASLSEPAP